MKLLILVSALAVVNCKPHGPSSLEDDPAVQSELPAKVSLLPYYGGAKGQTLQIVELPNGTVSMEIIPTPPITESSSETFAETSHPSELEMPQLPARPHIDYGTNIKNLHQTALNIIKLQEAVKRHGQLSQVDEKEYRENLDSLNVAAENLAKLQLNEDDLIDFNDRPGLSPWFERKRVQKVDKDKKKEEEKRKEEERKKKEEAEKKKAEEEQKKKEEEEKRKQEKEREEEKEKEEEKEEEEEQEEEQEGDTAIASLPPDDSSVAEAKPVGLAIAGIGGVAASKPIATAVVGPGGLAVARPVGTAIAGVSPDQSLVPIYAEGEEPPSKKKKGQNKGDKKKLTPSEYLNRIISRYHQV